jgi:glutathione S-transferase
MFGAKAEIAVWEKGIDCEIEHVPFSLTAFYGSKHPEVARINPKGQVPVLVDGDLEIFDSTQVFEFFEDLKPSPPLWPKDLRARARARRLELESDEVFFPHVVALMPHQRAILGEAKVAEAKPAIAAFYERIERTLEGREYLAGEFSYADIAFFMGSFFARVLGAVPDPGHEKMTAWRERIAARASVARVAGAMQKYLAQHGLEITLV